MAKKNNTNNTFIEITNQDVYKELKDVRAEINEKFECVIQRQDKTNGKVKLTFWIATTAFTVLLLLIVEFVRFVQK